MILSHTQTENGKKKTSGNANSVDYKFQQIEQRGSSTRPNIRKTTDAKFCSSTEVDNLCTLT
jgi:hypothetical protein